MNIYYFTYLNLWETWFNIILIFEKTNLMLSSLSLLNDQIVMWGLRCFYIFVSLKQRFFHFYISIFLSKQQVVSVELIIIFHKWASWKKSFGMWFQYFYNDQFIGQCLNKSINQNLIESLLDNITKSINKTQKRKSTKNWFYSLIFNRYMDQ